MADHGADLDFPAHERGYHRFIRVTRTGAMVCFLVAAFVIFIITR